MKKILIIILFITLPILLNAQLSGNGTFASPYYGTFQGDLQWNITNFPGSKIFINDDVLIDNELLTIGSGISVIFLSESADLIINGTGRLVASGTVGNLVTFTSDDDNDGNYGETNERWGHIVFDDPSSSNQSRLGYCIIEFGDVRTGSNTTTYGGGIYSNVYSNLVIDNCIIRNNKASHGGGIMTWNGASPTISNTIVTGNSANTSGGGLYLNRNANSQVTNCIIDNNICGGGGGGAVFLDACSNTLFMNSILVKNFTYATARGFNIQYFSITSTTNRPRFINSIIWDADNSIDYYITTPDISDFINCAIRDIQTPASSFTGCIDLSTSNSGATGPNFTDPVLPGTDWSIKFFSPCRDAGSTLTPLVPEDFIGNSRIGPYDIGAYEVQYSSWSTDASTTSWTTASNWENNVDPSSGTGDVIIPTSLTVYPTGTPAPDFTIGSENIMILEPGAKVTLGALTNNGILQLKSDADNIASLIISSYAGSGSEEIELYLTGGYLGDPEDNIGRWHYISSPVSSLPVSTFAPGTTYDLAHYVESRPVGSLSTGWVAFDGFIYPAGPINPALAFSTLDRGWGYNYWDNNNNTFTFGGTLNTSSVPVTLSYSKRSDMSLSGFNLLGNPFSSGLDWDYILENTSYPDSTSKGIYFTKDNEQYSYVGGVLVPEDGIEVTSGVIPPMQGFFVKTYGYNRSINLSPDARTHDNIPGRYKGTSVIPMVRLAITDNGTSDETVVRFADKAKPELDYDYDALKMFITTTKTVIYTSSGGTKFSINGHPFPETEIEIPVVVNITTDGNHIISTRQLQGLDNYDVTLTDNITGFAANLKTTSELTFSSAAGLLSNRFVLKISNVATGIEDPAGSIKIFNIYQLSDLLNIQLLSDEWDGKSGSVRILDMAGKPVTEHKNTEFSKNSVIQLRAPSATGLYLVEMRSGLMRHVGKLIIK